MEEGDKKIGDAICEDTNVIAKYIANLHANLYQPCNYYRSSDILNSIKDAKKASGDFSAECSRKITLEEILSIIKDLKNNKLSGNDGLTSEFYKTFANEVAQFLLAVHNEAFCKEELPPSLQQGLLTRIPKTNKDPLLVDNWRPITLLNDSKIIASVSTKRLKSGLN